MQLEDKLYFLVGDKLPIDIRPLQPYDERVCEFLNDLSVKIMGDLNCKKNSDIVTFGFWCRRANILRLKEKYLKKLEEDVRIGRGLMLHITPSNVPVNFVFSYVFSLLAGNSNIVRVPSRAFKQVDILCKVIMEVLNREEYKVIKEMTAFVWYEKNDEITKELLEISNGRIIWGGDETIKNIRNMPLSPRDIEVVFGDRYSFCSINAETLCNKNDEEIGELVSSFYNDTYFMDQNACSTPHLIIWLGKEISVNQVKKIFWQKLYNLAKTKYKLQDIIAIDKYVKFCQDVVELSEVKSVTRYDNFLYVLELANLNKPIEQFRGKAGYFYEITLNDINNIADIISTKCQTLTYYGIEKDVIKNFIKTNRLIGIDRIVPIGQAMDMSIIWDGYDLVASLSRVCIIS